MFEETNDKLTMEIYSWKLLEVLGSGSIHKSEMVSY